MFGWFKSKPKLDRYYMIKFNPQWWIGPEKKGRKAFNKIFGEDGGNFITEIDGVELESSVTFNTICPEISFEIWMERLRNIDEEALTFFVKGETYKDLKVSKYFSVFFEEDYTEEINSHVESIKFKRKFKGNKVAIVKKLGLDACDGCDRLLSTYLDEGGRCIVCRERMIDHNIIKEVTDAL